jgi:hypothetical protein
MVVLGINVRDFLFAFNLGHLFEENILTASEKARKSDE